MSDDQYTKEDWEKINKFAVEKAGSILDSAEHPHFAKRNLILSGIFNIVLFLGWLLFPRIILWLLPNDPDVLFDFYIVYVFLIIGTFACGFVFAYSAFRLYRIYYSDKTSKQIDSGFMSGFSYVDSRDKNWKIWLISAAAGVVNLLLIRVLVIVLGQTIFDQLWK